MRARSTVLSAVVAMLCVSSSPVLAQAGAPMLWEFGVDGALSFNRVSPGGGAPSTTFTTIDLPLGLVRAGFFVTPEISIEPQLQFTRTSGGGGSSSQTNLIIGGLYHFSTNRAMPQFYVRPFIDYLHFSDDPGGSGSQTGFGVGFGMKRSITQNNRIGARFEANIATYDGNSNFNDVLAFGLQAGISIFTR